MRSSSAPSFVIDPIDGFSTDLIEALRDRRVRDHRRLFLAEGARFLCAARDHRIPIGGIAVCERRVPSATRELLSQVR